MNIYFKKKRGKTKVHYGTKGKASHLVLRQHKGNSYMIK
jgi:hypothetical protein